ncbi:MAG: glycosyltransferase family 2 protein [bacterium]|jgi:cellulose synthase/poly-beta-1,6-N-acetylglucosamine synthase-like glycosyltransferase
MMVDFLHYSAVISTTIVAGMVIYQFFLTIGAFIHHRRTVKEMGRVLPGLEQFPAITILVPAHNEELVIERTVKTLLSLRYPQDKLTLMVINDASTDGTAAILDRLHEQNPRVEVFHRHKPDGGQGKAAALNAAALRVKDDYIAIYDADNCPEPDALLLLMARFIAKPSLAAAVGKFRCGNKRQNFLTRCVNIEGLCFQGVVQAGRHMLLDIAFLTGTNYVIKKDILLEVGGWDEEALAEDSELSTRLYMERYRVDYVPYSQTWEQEPETMKVWMTQRTRWARGNNYAISKLIRHFGSSKDKARTFENLFMLTMSYSFLIALVISQVALMLSLFGFEHLNHDAGWIFYFWQFSALFYFAQIWFALSLEREAQPESLLVGFLMYFFYGYLWMFAILRALYHDVVVRKARNWDKTVRFETELEVGRQN